MKKNQRRNEYVYIIPGTYIYIYIHVPVIIPTLYMYNYIS